DVQGPAEEGHHQPGRGRPGEAPGLLCPLGRHHDDRRHAAASGGHRGRPDRQPAGRPVQPRVPLAGGHRAGRDGLPRRPVDGPSSHRRHPPGRPADGDRTAHARRPHGSAHALQPGVRAAGL
ncbi:MAG: hypothetical protein AVDCRST_MAG76-3028, partial [uncultured Acidimicrobiales bacterium]